jgi:hypothetical protein
MRHQNRESKNSKPNPLKQRKAHDVRLRQLRAFYNRGLASVKQHPRNGNVYGMIAASAAEAGDSGELLRKARIFADKDDGYSRSEFERLLKSCDRGGHALGLSHIVRLLSLPKARGKRRAMQDAAIENRWSRRRLDAEIASLYGNRAKNAVGKKAAKPDTVEVALYRIARQCEQWRRLCLALAEAGELRIPEPIKGKLASVTRAFKALQEELPERMKSRASVKAKSKGSRSRIGPLPAQGRASRSSSGNR